MPSVQEIAKKRIDFLLDRARDMYDEDKELAKKYVVLARKIGTGHRVKIGNRSFCKKCDTVYLPGRTVKVRLSGMNKAVLYVCLNCNNVKKFMLG